MRRNWGCRDSDTEDYEPEVGCLSVQVVGARNINLPVNSQASYMDRLLNPQIQQVNPYCKISLGVSECPSMFGILECNGRDCKKVWSLLR